MPLAISEPSTPVPPVMKATLPSRLKSDAAAAMAMVMRGRVEVEGLFKEGKVKSKSRSREDGRSRSGETLIMFCVFSDD